MQSQSWELVSQWWADLLGLDAADLWRPGVTVTAHARLTDDDGLVVVEREDGVHVSAPSWLGRSEAAYLTQRAGAELLERRFWSEWPPVGERKADRAVVHAYTDRQVEPAGHVERIDPAEVASWEDIVSPRKWRASGFDEHVNDAFGVRSHGSLAAASNLTRFRGSPPTLGILTHPAHRGQGFATRVARTATAAAVQQQGSARYRSEADHARSQAIGRTLGYEPYCRALSVR
ncbi:MAG: GNAT family N-acetyltransferase [Nocardioidaceae bacterium]